MPNRADNASGTIRHAVWRAPGRVNLIGEHTDYNAGFALPFAIEQSCRARVSTLDRAVVSMRSAQAGPAEDVELDALRPGDGGQWSAYAAGAVWALRRRAGDAVGGVSIEIDSDVPVGSGLSSSAALVCAVTTALDELFGLELSAAELLAVSREVENDFVGAPTGGMDQLASLRCTEGNALFCDMRSLDTRQVPFDVDADGLTVLVIDTRAPHAHSDGEYRARREGCERAAAQLGVAALRDIGVADLDDALARLDDDGSRRYVRHVVTEDDRVLRTVELLDAGRVREIAPLLTASHESMRDDFRITVPPVDVAVDELIAAGALGARMTGGGFGGCVIALVESGLADHAAGAVRDAYRARGFAEPAHFTTRPAAGARPA